MTSDELKPCPFCGEHDGYVRNRLSNFYYRNACFHKRTVPCRLTLAFNVNDYDITSRRKASDFDDDDVVMDVPMYREQHFDWDSGSARGLCFVRKGAKESVRNEFDNLCDDAMRSFVSPIVGMADKFIDEATEKLRELEGRGLATPRDRAYLTHIAKYERIFSKFRDDIAKENDEYRLEVMSIGDEGRDGGGEW